MEEIKPGYYAVIPANVRYDDSIPANAKLLYGEISSLVSRDGFCTETNQYFADLYQCKEETVSRWMSKLAAAGYIIREDIRGQNGQISQRKIYLSVSVIGGLPFDKIINTPCQKSQGGIDEKVKEYCNYINNLFIQERKKENIKEKKKEDIEERVERSPLDDTQLTTRFVDWINGIGSSWPRETKNAVYLALLGFYAPREKKKQEPSRAESAVTALCNRLARYSQGNPSLVLDMLEHATGAAWKSVFPPKEFQQATPADRPLRANEVVIT